MPEYFPIMSEQDSPAFRIPWGLAERARSQMERNHSQTMERLAERGGLSAREMAMALQGIPLKHVVDYLPSDGYKYVMKRVTCYNSDLCDL